MTTITSIHGRQILDSRGNPTVEVDVSLSDGSIGRVAVPSGASTGRYEAVEKRDGDKAFYAGKSVLETLEGVNTVIASALVGQSPFDQNYIDDKLIKLDGTDNKSRLGANAILGVSLAIAQAAAQAKDIPFYRYLTDVFQNHGGSGQNSLPMPMMNLVNGGAHSDAPIDIQEFMIIPVGAPTFSEALRMGAEIFHALKSLLSDQGLTVAVGDEGGFAPHLPSPESVLENMVVAGQNAGYNVGKDFVFALDAAATEFYNEDTGQYEMVGAGKTLSSQELVAYYQKLATTFPIVSIEDGMAEDDFAGWALLQKTLGSHVQIVGDDLFVTNPKRLQMGFDQNLANSILIKLNQIGTLSETLATIAMAQKHGFTCVISHRSGETEDTTIADLAVATNAGQIKTGSLSRTDRICKYNQLLRIQEDLGADVNFANPFQESMDQAV